MQRQRTLRLYAFVFAFALYFCPAPAQAVTYPCNVTNEVFSPVYTGLGSVTNTWFICDGTQLQNFMSATASPLSLGIGTTSPEATLDVNGYMRLAKNSSQPVACSSTYDGAIALTHVYTLCVCKGNPVSSSWLEASDGVTTCSW